MLRKLTKLIICFMIRCRLCSTKKAYLKHKVGFFYYYFCTSCQTLFLNPSLSKREVDNYYKNNFNYSSGIKNKNRISVQAEKIIKKLKKYNVEGKTLLDIGAGYGYFIDQAAKNELEPIGLEPAKKILHVKNDYILPQTFDSYRKNNIDEKFDFITLIHVIEHLNNPKTVVNRAISMLKPKGILCMETPNLDSHLYNREKDRYTFLTPPDHQWIFSRKSINEFFGKNSDVRIMRITTYSYSEHFMKIIKSIFFKKMNVAQTDKSRKDNQENLGKKAKYIFFDQTLAPLFVWIINLFNKGTFLQVYIKKL